MRNQLTNANNHVQGQRSVGNRHSAANAMAVDLSSQPTLQLFKRSRVAAGIASMCFVSGLSAAPSMPEVMHGSAAFNQQGRHLEISSSHGTIINWQDFSIASHESVNFLQTHASSAILNRVISNIPSNILGELTSNGRVFVINPNGLVIGKDATIDTAAFVASTLAITDQDFIAGRMKFVGDSGEIENHGYIAVAPGGEVVLIAPSIENHGVIEAPDGGILLAAGREVVLHSMQSGGLSYKVSAPGDRALNIGQLVAANGSVKVFADQIFQSGTITANRARRNANGNIVLEADTALSASGTIAARGVQTGGGVIHLLADQIEVSNADIDASGEGGGEILIGGDYQGKGTVRNATNTNTDAASVIRADGGTRGDGGRIIVWSDNTTNTYARITARGGTESGDGGFLETSGKQTLNFGQPADVSASNGRAGTWLLDPEDIVIGETQADSISISLSGGSNVEVRTSDEGDGAGNITVDAPITKSDGDDAVTLTLDAHNRVDVNAPITTTAGPLNLTIKTGRQVVAVDLNEQTPEPGTEDHPEDEQEAAADGTGVAVEASETDGSEVAENAEAAVAEEDDAGVSELVDGASAEADESTSEAEESASEAEELASEAEELAELDSDDGDNASTDVSAEGIEADGGEVTDSGDSNGGEVESDIAAQTVEVAETDEASDVTSASDSAAATSATEVVVASESGQSSGSGDSSELEVAAPETDNAAPDSAIVDVPDDVTDVAAADTSEIVPVVSETGRDDPLLQQAQASEIDNFVNESAQQVVIAADLHSGGGNIIIDSGVSGDAIISANISSADHVGAVAGDITIEGQHIAIVDDSNIEASADEAGTILIGGGLQGQDPTVDNSEVVILAAGSSVSADGGTHGDGGTVIVFSQQSSIVSGNLSARGGTQGGNGGYIETSGLATLRVANAPDVGANNGAGGTWLIDPYDVNVGAGDSMNYTVTTGPGEWSAVPDGASAFIPTAVIQNALYSGNVTISTTNATTLAGSGNIYFYADLSFNNPGMAPAGSLTLNAYRDIYFTGGIDTSFVSPDGVHDLNLYFNAGVDNMAAEGSISISSGSAGIFTGGNLIFNANLDVNIDRAIYSDAGNVTLNTQRNINVTADISALGGIDLNANVGGNYSGNQFNGTATNNGDGYGVVTISNNGFDLSLYGGYGVLNIQGAGLTVESSGCGPSFCSSGISLSADDINLGTSSSVISGDILFSSTATAGQYGGGILAGAGNLSISAGTDLAISNPAGSYGVSLLSNLSTDINVQNDLTLAGSPYISAAGFNTFTTSIVTYGDLNIDVGGTLTLDSGEIFLQSANTDLMDYFGELGPGSAADTITVNNLHSSNGLIVFNRDQNSANLMTYAPGELILTTNGADSQIIGVENPVGPDDYGLALRSVTWLQNGDLTWGSGSIELTQASIDFSPNNTEIANDSIITNNGTFAVNSETGDFIFHNSPMSIEVFYNTGSVVKDAGVGTTNFEVEFNNSGNLLAYAGNINLGNGGLYQTAGATVLRNGNLSVEGGSDGFFFVGGALAGGMNGTNPDGGTLIGPVYVKDTVISPGFSPGILTVDGDFDASAGGNSFDLEVDVDSGEHDLLLITGDAIITGNNTVNVNAIGDFQQDPYAPFYARYTVISASGGMIDVLPTMQTVSDPTVSGSEATLNSIDFGVSFDVIFNRAALPVPPPPNPTPPPPAPPPVTVATATVTPTVPDPEPMLPAEPEVIVIVIDEQPVVVPLDIANIIVTLSDEERQAYLESERVRQKLKKVNQCIGKA